MSIALTDRGRATVRAALPWVPWAVLALGLALLAVDLTPLHDMVLHRGSAAASAGDAGGAADTPAVAAPTPAVATTVSLPEGKFRAAKLATEPARLESLPAELGVPGRIDANLNREMKVRPRASGVIRAVKAELGQTFKKGETLAVLDSPDIGTARLGLRARQNELATTRIEADWKKQVSANVAALIADLRKRAEPELLEKAYADRPLGTFRATLLQAYAEYDIAMHEEEKTAGLFRQNIVGEHPKYVTMHTRQGAQAKFEAALEQARFDARIQTLMAAQAVKKAEADVIDSALRLRILGVPEDVKALLATAGEVAAAPQSTGDDVTAYPVLAPFDGTILTKAAVASQRAETTDVLFTLADLSTVWVQANIPESDFALLPALKQGTIRLAAAAYPDRSFVAKLLSVGATVDPTTRTVPMLAETANPDGLLKVGLFVRITLDTAVDRKALTVPSAALVEIEGRKGVFVPAGGQGHSFTFKPVKLGRESGDRLVVASGLAPGDPVVSSPNGAFLLKSELVLQNEPEEE